MAKSKLEKLLRRRYGQFSAILNAIPVDRNSEADSARVLLRDHALEELNHVVGDGIELLKGAGQADHAIIEKALKDQLKSKGSKV